MKSLRKTTKNVMSAMLTADLTIVTLWAVFLINTAKVGYPGIAIVSALVIWRLWVSFDLYRRQKKALWLILVWIAAVACTAIFGNIDIMVAPFGKMCDVIKALLTGNNSVFARDDEMSVWGTAFTAVCVGWVVLMPVLAYAALAVKKLLVSVKWIWRNIVLVIAGYAGCTLLVYFYPFPSYDQYVDFFLRENTNILDTIWYAPSRRMIWLLVTGAMLVFAMSKICRAYKAVLLYAITAYALILTATAGLMGEMWISLAVLLICSFGFCTMLYKRCDGTKWHHANLLIGVVLAANVLFWCSQFCTYLMRYMMLVLSLVMLITIAVLYYRAKHKAMKSVGLVLMCGFVFPTLSIGYNVAACPGAARYGDCKGYAYAQFCLFKVRGNDGVGIRDRYGMVMPAEYDDFQLMDVQKPFYKINQGGLWGIYDVERQEMVVEPECLSINRVDEDDALIKNTWEMTYKGYESPYSTYFKMPSYYGRHGWDFDISNEPYRHYLDRDLTLQYCPYADGVEDVEAIDFLLASIITKLWQHSDDEPIADVYWQWTQDVTEMIDSLATTKGLFCDSTLNRCDKAVDVLKSYIDGGSTQCEMNNASYVIAVLDLYKVHKQNIDFTMLFDGIDMRREYQLYNQYMKALEDWEARVSDAYGERYSAKPMEDNIITSMRCEDRCGSLKEMMDVIQGQKRIISTKPRPTNGAVMKKYHESIPGILIPARHPDDPEPAYPIDTLGIYLLQWAAYRDSIADLMPATIGQSYKNQTTNLIHEMMPPTKPDPYEHLY